MAFLKNVVVRSNDKDNLLPADEPTDNAYVLWKDKNYSDSLLAALNNHVSGYRHAYANSNMQKFFKVLKANGLLSAVEMARTPRQAVMVEGAYVLVGGEKIYVDEEGFEV